MKACDPARTREKHREAHAAEAGPAAGTIDAAARSCPPHEERQQERYCRGRSSPTPASQHRARDRARAPPRRRANPRRRPPRNPSMRSAITLASTRGSGMVAERERIQARAMSPPKDVGRNSFMNTPTEYAYPTWAVPMTGSARARRASERRQGRAPRSASRQRAQRVPSVPLQALDRSVPVDPCGDETEDTEHDRRRNHRDRTARSSTGERQTRARLVRPLEVVDSAA